MGAMRVFTSGNQLVSALQSGDCKVISFSVLQTTVSVIALASTIFAHPLGMIITTSQDIIFELSDLLQTLQRGDWEASLISLTKITNNAFYLALMCRGGLELSIASLAMQAITLMISAREEFKKGHSLEAWGNLLMAGVRMHQGYSQFKTLQRQWEIQEIIKRIAVGGLHEKWQFPSDHLPIGVEVDGVKIISWNVLNTSSLGHWTDAQGLDGSMITDLNKVIRPNGLTQRELLIAELVASMTASGHVVALQECGTAFLEALQEKLPPHWKMVKSFEGPRIDQEVVLYDTSKLDYRAEQSKVTQDSYPSVPGRPLQYAVFSKAGEKNGRNLGIANAHIPGNPALPAREELAKYIHDIHRDDQTTVVVGDNNFERDQMIRAYENQGFSDPFSMHSPWKTNVDPMNRNSKAIDHCFVAGGRFSRDLTPDEVLRNGNLQETIDLLNTPGAAQMKTEKLTSQDEVTRVFFERCRRRPKKLLSMHSES